MTLSPHLIRSAEFFYVYDGDGNIVRSIDISAQKEYNYEYEVAREKQLIIVFSKRNRPKQGVEGASYACNAQRLCDGGDCRIVRATESDITLNGEVVTSKVIVNTVKYYYDTEGKMTKKVITPAGGSAQTIYYETNDDNTVVKFSAGGRTVTSHSKTDSFGRKVFDELQLGTGFVSRQFSYHAGEVTQEHINAKNLKSSATTQLVSQIALSDGRTISYEYDNEERIIKVTDSVDGVTEYTYDALGQLLTETVTKDGVTTVVNSMEYDNYGNITKKNGKTYTYGDAKWKDLLTGFDGKTIEYDAQGNPVKYLGHTLTWEKGRQLKCFDGNTYTYNANGIRTSKIVNGIKHEYTLDGTRILRETWDGNTLIPLYNNEDSVCGIVHNDIPYYFIKNLQGDIIAITDDAGVTVARYTYDAWGKCTIVSDNSGVGIASINPFRYRSYYYDTETELYYLQSRYYDPEISRFINEDNEQSLLSEGLGCIGYNIFTYCQNNPINGSDIDGCAFIQVVAKIILGIILGIYIQLVFDILDYLLNLLSDPNATFSASGKEYILSILSSILSFFSFKKRWVRISISALQIIFSYLGNSLTKQVWANIITDLMFLFVSEIIGGSLDRKNAKKIEKATKTINKSKKKLSKILKIAKLNKKKLIIEEKFYALGVGITFSLNISNKLINSVANYFIK